MKKTLFILSFIISLTTFAKNENDIKKLDATIKHFGKKLISQDSLHADFKLSYEQYKKIYLEKRPKSSEEKIQKEYKYIMQKDKGTFRKFQNKQKYLNKVLSYDTITYTSSGQKLINVYFKYEMNKKGKQAYDQDIIYVLARFLIIDSKLIFAQKIRSSLMTFDVDRLERSYDNVRKTYKPLLKNYFYSSAHGFVPVKKGKRWTLQSLEDGKILDNSYDTIYSFKNDYAHVVKNNKHNLLNLKGKEVLKDWYKQIKYKKLYLVQLDNNEWKTFPNNFTPDGDLIKKEPTIEEEEEELQVDVVYETATAGTSNNKKEMYKRLRKKNKVRILRDSLSREYYKSRTTKVHLYQKNKGISRYSKNKNYFILDHTTLDTIAFIKNYEYMGSLSNYFKGIKNDSTFVFDEIGEVFFKTTYTTKSESPGYLILFDQEVRLFGAYCPHTKTYIPPKYKYIKPIDRDQFFVVITENGQLGYLDKTGKELF